MFCSFGGGKNKLKLCFHDLPSIQLATTGWSYKVWGSRSHSQHFIYSFCLFVPALGIFYLFVFVYSYHSLLPNSLCLFTDSLNILFNFLNLFVRSPTIHSVLFPCPPSSALNCLLLHKRLTILAYPQFSCIIQEAMGVFQATIMRLWYHSLGYNSLVLVF